MRTQILSFSLLAGLSVASVSAFAEPPVQAGETLESLSKVKVTTTVNGQPGSLNELIASGQIKPIQSADAATTATPQIDPNKVAVEDPNAAADATAVAPSAEPAQAVEEPSEAPQIEPEVK